MSATPESSAATEPEFQTPSDLPFGHCGACGEPLERPFWDTYCFDCQRGDEEDLDEWD